MRRPSPSPNRPGLRLRGGSGSQERLYVGALEKQQQTKQPHTSAEDDYTLTHDAESFAQYLFSSFDFHNTAS